MRNFTNMAQGDIDRIVTPYFSIATAVQSVSWRGYKVTHDNGRYIANGPGGTFYLTTNDGRRFYWEDYT